VEFLTGSGAHFVAYGLHEDTGLPYTWPYAVLGAEPLACPRDGLVEVSPDQVRECARRIAALLTELGYENVKITNVDGGTRPGADAALEAESHEDLLAAAEVIENGDCDWDRWNTVGMAIWAATAGSETGREAFQVFSAKSSKHDATAANERWDHYSASPPTRGGAGSVFYWAREAEAGWQRPSQSVTAVFGEVPPPIVPDHAAPIVSAGLIISVPASAIAHDFASKNHKRLRYVTEWNKWMIFNGQSWVEHSQTAVWNMMLPVVREQVNQLQVREDTKRNLLSRSKTAGAEALARGHLRIAAAAWDADPWLLNTPKGVVDLRTGDIHGAAADAYCKRITAAGPGGECPQWQRFLAEVTGGDAELQKYLQRLAGYALIGKVLEHVLVFFYGTGGNGKGVFLGVLTAVLGDYAQVAPIALFTEKKNEQHPTVIARLQGKRFVSAQETDEGRFWDEVLIKTLTGGDRLTGRFMRGDFFEFDPHHTLIIAGNHKPQLHNVDEAVRRRIHMVPFNVTIPEAKRDPELRDKLMAEASGIMQWALDGCLAYQRIGLAAPAAVKALTAEYLAEQDPMQGWLAECCLVDPAAWSSVDALYASYTSYTMRESKRALGVKSFGQKLESLGYERRRGTDASSVRGFQGLRLK
jgi:putative DNA primase/helicase